MSIWRGSLCLVLFFSIPSATTAADAVEVSQAKYAELAGAVGQQRGNVVLVDFWSLTCIPCRRALPHLMQLQARFRTSGLRIITVSLDSPKNVEQVRQVLQKLKATTANLLLSEPTSVVTDKLKVKAIPCLYLFDRQGRIERKFTQLPNHTELEQLIVQLLQEREPTR